MHVHVYNPDGEAKYWLAPEIALARSHGLSVRALQEVEALVHAHEMEIRDAWRRHFPG